MDEQQAVVALSVLALKVDLVGKYLLWFWPFRPLEVGHFGHLGSARPGPGGWA